MWSESGMNYSDDTTRSILQFLKDTMGIIPIETHQATDILACLLSSPMNQLVVVPGLRDKIQYFIQKSCQDNPNQEQMISSDTVNLSEIIEKTNDTIQGMISDILGIEPDDIDCEENI